MGQAKVYQTVVVLRQIDRLLDYSRNVLDDLDDKDFDVRETDEFPVENVRSFLWREKGTLRRVFGLLFDGDVAHYFDEGSNVVKIPKGKPRYTEVLQAEVGTDVENSHYRSFDRAASSVIPDGHYVYVFQCANGEGKPSHGAAPRLYAELRFEGGKFRRMSPTQWARSKQDWERLKAADWQGDEQERKIPNDARLEEETELLLDLHATSEKGLTVWNPPSKPGAPPSPASAHYFFYLAERQLPWDGIERIKANLGGRAVRLYDWLYTDFCTSKADLGNSAAWQTLVPKNFGMHVELRPQPDLSRYQNGPIYFVLHLPNVMKETDERATAYINALGQILPDIVNKPPPEDTDKKLALARTIDVLTRNDEKLRELVKKKLFPVIYPDVNAPGDGTTYAYRRLAVIHSCARELMEWMGMATRRIGTMAFWDHQPLKTKMMVASNWIREESSPPSCTFSDAADDYLHAPEETRSYIADTYVTKAMAYLSQTAAGQVFLDKTLQLNLGKDEPRKVDGRQVRELVAGDGGLSLVLSLLKDFNKDTKAGALAIKTALSVYTNPWLRYAGNKHARAEIEKWVTRRGRAGRLTFVDLEKNGEMKWRLGDKKLHLDESKKAARIAGGVQSVLTLRSAIDNAVGILSSAQKIKEGLAKNDTEAVVRGAVDATGSAVGLVEDCDTLRRTLTSVAKGKPLAKAPAFITPLSYVASAISVGTAGYELLQGLAWNDAGEITGNSLKLAAACASLITVTVTGVGTLGLSLLITGVVWLLNWVGDKVIEQFREPARFLRACEFGEHVSFVDDINVADNIHRRITQGQFGDDSALVEQRKMLPTWTTRYDELWQRGWTPKQQLAVLESEILYLFQLKQLCRLEREGSRPSVKGLQAVTVALVVNPRFPQCFVAGWNWSLTAGKLRIEERHSHAVPNNKSPFQEVSIPEVELAWDAEIEAGRKLHQWYRDRKWGFVIDLHTVDPAVRAEHGGVNNGPQIGYYTWIELTGQLRLTITPTLSGEKELTFDRTLNHYFVVR